MTMSDVTVHRKSWKASEVSWIWMIQLLLYINWMQTNEPISIAWESLWAGRHRVVSHDWWLAKGIWGVCCCGDRHEVRQWTAKDTDHTVLAIWCAWSWRSNMTVIYGSATAMDTGKIVQAFGVHGVEEVIKQWYTEMILQ